MILAPWIMRLYLLGVTDPAEHAAQLELGTFFLGGSSRRSCSTGWARSRPGS